MGRIKMGNTPAEQKDLELRLYDVVDIAFHVANSKPIGGLNPNASFIAKGYGCRLEFREGYFKHDLRFNIIRPPEVRDDYSCTAAVLVGEDWEKLVKAREDIRNTFGRVVQQGAQVRVSAEIAAPYYCNS